MKLKRTVVMLPTNQRAAKQGQPILSVSGPRLYLAWADTDDTKAYTLQHLSPTYIYILSDEPIKEDGWFIDSNTNKVHKCKRIDDTKLVTDEIDLHEPFGNAYYYFEKSESKKIIATTDKSLSLPSPSPEFIQAYIKAYNAGKKIEEVMVEYEGKSGIILSYGRGIVPPDIHVKVDSNNCITITKVKDSWTREEVIALCRDCFDDSCKYSSFNEWIEQNL